MNLNIDFKSFVRLSIPIILCVYYSYTLITVNYIEKVVTFSGGKLKPKIFFGVETHANTSTNNYGVCLTERAVE